MTSISGAAGYDPSSYSQHYLRRYVKTQCRAVMTVYYNDVHVRVSPSEPYFFCVWDILPVIGVRVLKHFGSVFGHEFDPPLVKCKSMTEVTDMFHTRRRIWELPGTENSY